jgi:hypothetical protein
MFELLQEVEHKILAMHHNYDIAIKFIKSLTTRPCRHMCECVSCDAFSILKELGDKNELPRSP